MSLGSDARLGAALGTLDALYRSGEDLLGRAQRRAPLDEGTLRGSGTLVLIVNGARLEGAGGLAQAKLLVADLARRGAPIRLDAEVAFNTVYAARQHEDLRLSHSEGEAKYLERPLAEQADRYGRIMALAASNGASRA